MTRRFYQHASLDSCEPCVALLLSVTTYCETAYSAWSFPLNLAADRRVIWHDFSQETALVRQGDVGSGLFDMKIACFDLSSAMLRKNGPCWGSEEALLIEGI